MLINFVPHRLEGTIARNVRPAWPPLIAINFLVELVALSLIGGVSLAMVMAFSEYLGR